MNLANYDWIILNSSAGKDSQALTDHVCRLARAQGVRERVLMVHAELANEEWLGTRQLAEYHASTYGVPFHTVARRQGLLEHILQRGRWPDKPNRYCTSDHKRDQIAKLIRTFKGRILNCIGLRAQESPDRAKKLPLTLDKRLTTKTREVWTWLPLHDWTIDQVWACVHASPAPYHYAYDLGMSRLSCMFCVFGSKSDLQIAAEHNPRVLFKYIQVLACATATRW
jgi:3'-phosphoadenosine 5'-phosphosulfate sulfotransferase (PAPS reductase)/FAD synthetase